MEESNNLILGPLELDHQGQMTIKNWSDNSECVLNFKPRASNGSWFGLGSKTKGDFIDGEITGSIKASDGMARWIISGSWQSHLQAQYQGNAADISEWLRKPIVLWTRTPPHPDAVKNFNLTSFAMGLNDFPKELESVLPPTDSRRRTDQSLMEQSQWDLANQAKESLENNQRLRREELVATFKATKIADGPLRDVSGIPFGEDWHTPRFFTRQKDPDTKEEHWVFSDEYWNLREDVASGKRKWPEYMHEIQKYLKQMY